MNDPNIPGKGAAVGSLVCGIVSLIFSLVLGGMIFPPLVGLILGIIGLVLASNARKAGYDEGLRTAGFVVSLLGTIFGGLVFASCTALIGCLGVLGSLSAVAY